jgi:hypothetical protein
MAEKLDRKETVDLKQVILSGVVQGEALINLLEKKGIISRKELLEEVKRVAAKIRQGKT